MLAHRASYEEHVGPIPDGMNVLHRCDNPPCIDPDHLFPGTQGDNVEDRDRKGRGNWARGERCHKAKLTEDDVRAIRASGKLNIEIAKDYGVSNSLIGMIKNRKIWKHIT